MARPEQYSEDISVVVDDDGKGQFIATSKKGAYWIAHVIEQVKQQGIDLDWPDINTILTMHEEVVGANIVAAQMSGLKIKKVNKTQAAASHLKMAEWI